MNLEALNHLSSSTIEERKEHATTTIAEATNIVLDMIKKVEDALEKVVYYSTKDQQYYGRLNISQISKTVRGKEKSTLDKSLTKFKRTKEKLRQTLDYLLNSQSYQRIKNTPVALTSVEIRRQLEYFDGLDIKGLDKLGGGPIGALISVIPANQFLLAAAALLENIITMMPQSNSLEISRFKNIAVDLRQVNLPEKLVIIPKEGKLRIKRSAK